MNEVKATISADANSYLREAGRIEQALERNRRALEQLAHTNNQLNKTAKEGNEQQARGLGDVMVWAGKAAAAYVTLKTVMAAVNVEAANYRDLLQKISAQSNTEAAALERLYTNVPDRKEAGRLANVARDMARERAVPIPVAMDALTQAVSARGEAPVKLAEDAARIALRAMPNNQSEATALAGSIVEARLVTKQLDAAANFGVMATLQNVSRPVSMASTSAYLVPGAAAAQKNMPAEQFDWLSIAAAMTGYGGDRSGEITKTAVQSLSHKMADWRKGPQIAAALADQAGFGALGTAGAFEAAGGIGGLEYFWKHQEAARSFLDDAKFGARAMPGVSELLLSPEVRGNVLENRAAMRRATPQLGDELLRGLESEPAYQASKAARTVQSTVEQMLSKTSVDSKISAQVRGQVRELLQVLGAPGMALSAYDKLLDSPAGAGPGRQAQFMETEIRRWADQPHEQDMVAETVRTLQEVQRNLRRPVDTKKHAD